jgi:hypothetical protein
MNTKYTFNLKKLARYNARHPMHKRITAEQLHQRLAHRRKCVAFQKLKSTFIVPSGGSIRLFEAPAIGWECRSA